MEKAGRFSTLAGGVSLALAAVVSGAYAIDAGAQSGMGTSYVSIAVVKPADKSTVFDNAGNVAVRVAVSPALRARNGDRVALIVDGKRAAVRSATHFRLSGIVRGEHTLEAQVVDGNGYALISSKPVNFYMWHASRLFINRHGK
ncbi:MAG: hypothetical protein ACYC7B_14620 [Burkholderiales bacterium]